jgi:hypothetical protein
MHAPLHPCLACNNQTGTIQPERYNGSASNRSFTNNEESVITPSEMCVPSVTQWVEERDNTACLWVKGFGFGTFERITEKPNRLPLKLSAVDPQQMIR